MDQFFLKRIKTLLDAITTRSYASHLLWNIIFSYIRSAISVNATYCNILS